ASPVAIWWALGNNDTVRFTPDDQRTPLPARPWAGFESSGLGCQAAGGGSPVVDRAADSSTSATTTTTARSLITPSTVLSGACSPRADTPPAAPVAARADSEDRGSPGASVGWRGGAC